MGFVRRGQRPAARAASALQHARTSRVDELLEALDRWAALLRAVEDDVQLADPYDLLDAIGWYLVDPSDLTEDEVQRAFQRHLHHPENQRMTTGQRIRMESRALGRIEGRTEGRNEGRTEGRNEGRTEGRNDGKVETLLRLLQRRFGTLAPHRSEQVRAAGGEQLDRWLDRLLEAASCDDVFASD